MTTYSNKRRGKKQRWVISRKKNSQNIIVHIILERVSVYLIKGVVIVRDEMI